MLSRTCGVADFSCCFSGLTSSECHRPHSSCSASAGVVICATSLAWPSRTGARRCDKLLGRTCMCHTILSRHLSHGAGARDICKMIPLEVVGRPRERGQGSRDATGCGRHANAQSSIMSGVRSAGKLQQGWSPYRGVSAGARVRVWVGGPRRQPPSAVVEGGENRPISGRR